jgi:ribose transport system ATP-binding protein
MQGGSPAVIGVRHVFSSAEPLDPGDRCEEHPQGVGATIAVNDVSFDVQAGDVHALLGENGAGKSTLVKLLSGLILPTTGNLSVFGKPAMLDSPQASHAHGIQTAFQELSMIKDLTVLDNMLMPYPPRNAFGQIRRREARRQVGAHLAQLGLGNIDPLAELRDLDFDQRQKIEIARALFRRPQILLLDEPTSTLSGRDIDWLAELIEKRRAEGVTIVFISHRMREVRAFCDRVTVLRNGKHIATERLADVGDEAVIDMIAGKALGRSFPPKLPVPSLSGDPVLGVRSLAAENRLEDVSFDLRRGEILGVAGLEGMGQLELFNALFGIEEPDYASFSAHLWHSLNPVTSMRCAFQSGFLTPATASFRSRLPEWGSLKERAC